MTLRNRNLAVLALAASALTPFLATAAQAQADPQHANTGLEEIVVTAQKREENVQSVPISITAVSSQELQNRSVSTIGDLQSATPNVTFGGTPQGTMATTVGIRGLRSVSVELVNDQPVAIYIDDVYQSSALGSMNFLGPDVDRVEVLRGPQGTLFGRNTLAGALSIHTKLPDTNNWGGRAMVGFGNHGLMEGQATVNVPLAKDLAGLRVNVGYRNNNGYIKDLTYGRKLGSTDQVFVRGQLRLSPSSNFDATITGDYVDARTGGAMTQMVYLRPGGLAATALGNFYGLDASTTAGFNAIISQVSQCGYGVTPNLAPRCISTSIANPTYTTGLFSDNARTNEYDYYREWGLASNMTLHLNDAISLKSITAYRSFKHFSSKDYDATPAMLLTSSARPSGKTFTQELQLNGTAADSRLKYTLGGYYYHFDGYERGTNSALVNFIGPNANFIQNHLVNKSLGGFSQATFAVTDRFNITGGIRYTSETKNVAINQYGARPVGLTTPLGYTCTLPIVPTGANTDPALCVNRATLKYNSWDWTARVDFRPVDGVMIYAGAAKGFQAGGINQRSTTGVPFRTYQPMTAINYEAGIKADLLDRHLRINASVFQQDVKNFQQTIAQTFTVPDPSDPTKQTSVSVVATLNAATARIRGFEGEVTVIPFPNARIAATVGYTDPKYGRFMADGPGGPNSLDLSKTDFKAISKWTFSVSPSYTLPTSWGEVHLQADYVYQSSQNLNPSLAFPRDVELPVPGLIQPGFGLLNARIAARINGSGETEIALWGKNLTDKRYFNAGLNLAASTGFADATVGDPRTFGVQISHKF